MSEGKRNCLLLVLMTVFSLSLHAQNQVVGTRTQKGKQTYAPFNFKAPADKSGVEKLSIPDRITLRTNVADWALMIPNIGVEFDVRGTTWNRWTVGANVRYNWQTKHTFSPRYVYNFFETRIEGRQYWRARQIGYRGLEPHTKIWDKAVSIRRRRVKHPTTTWYRGVFVSYDKYSFLLPITDGHEGEAIMAGVTYGFVRPLFGWSNGNSVDLEVGISGGFMAVRDATYRHDDVADSYPIVKKKEGWRVLPFPVPNEVRVGLVYRLGRYPALQKYRYRRDVDIVYDSHRDSIYQAHVKIREEKRHFKADYETILRHFWHVYDSIANVNRLKKEVPHGKKKK